MTTLEDKQKEIDALQSAFDEYIESSRELEEELDAELTKCQNELTKAESRNTALASQLSNIQPQFNSLETKLSSLTTQLSAETQRRISAEMKSEEAENKLRESEGTLAAVRSSEVRKLKEENEDLCERLAFVEGEAEDYRNELNTERERHREAVEELRADNSVLKQRLEERESGEVEQAKSNDQDGLVVDTAASEDVESIFDEKEAEEVTPTASGEQSGATSDEREEYIRTLEDELELVTEQLIEAETKLSQTQSDLEEALAEAEEQANKATVENGIDNDGSSATENSASADMTTQFTDKISELESTIKLLEQEHAGIKEELELALEELALSKEEIEAYELDRREQADEIDMLSKQHKDEVAALRKRLDHLSLDERSRGAEAKSFADALMNSKTEAQSLQEQISRLEQALNNSKTDCETLQQEMEDLKVAYDETANREKVESEGQHHALGELLATRSREVNELKEEVSNLTETNSSLTKMLNDMEENLQKKQTEISEHVASASTSSSQELQEAQDEIYSLGGLLEAARKELDEQRKEVQKVRSSLEEKIAHAQKELATAEDQLKNTQFKLLEVEKDRSAMQDVADEAALKRTKKMARMSLSLPLRATQIDTEEDQSSESDFHRSHALSRRMYSHKSRSRPRSCSPTTIQRLEGDAERRAATASSLQVECDRLQGQNRMSNSMKNHLDDEIKSLKKQLSDANSKEVLASNNEEKEEQVQDDLMVTDDANIEDVLQSNDPEVIATELRAMAKKMNAQKSHNAQLLTRILQLQGNIQVCCRIRPLAEDESHAVAQSLSESEVGCFDERTRQWKSFAFDKVWGADTSQKSVFQDVEPMALSVIDGYNACIFAYGQTGSGKTHTMEGNKANGQYGINQRFIQKIFNLLNEKAQQHQRNVTNDDESSFEYTIEVSMLEIYNDEVYDLLDPEFSSYSSSILGGSPRKKGSKKASLDIRQSTDYSTVEVPGLIKEKVDSVAEVLNALERGNSNRSKASTNLNEHSSRSHMILRVEVTSGVGEAKSKGNLYLVDLAGSERCKKSEAEGQTLKEAQHINKSLSALGNVMEALDRKASHVPYRDSKLTYLLSNSLGGNSRTMMIVTVCPHDKSYDETTFALKFATRVRRINLGSASKNVTAKNLEETVKNLTSEMSMLSKAKERSESQLSSLKKEKQRVEERLSRASTARAESKEETRTLSVLRQTNNDITARWQKEKSNREEKTVELGKVQEELQRVQRDMRNVKREQESLAKQNHDKENTIFQLKKDLRGMKEQLNEEKIRHRRTSVMQSRIPAPTKSTPSARKPLSSRNTSRLMRPTSRLNGASARKTDANTIRPADGKKNDPNSVARIRFRVLKILQEHDPTKVDKIDAVMNKFEGRETELLEKMIAKYENNEPNSVASPLSIGTERTTASSDDADRPMSDAGPTPDDDKSDGRPMTADARPKSRQDLALERHMNRMKRIQANKKK